MDDISKKLGLKLQQLGLSYQTNERLYDKEFAKPKSLYSSFKQITSDIEKFQVNDQFYLQILKGLIGQKRLSQFKGAQIFEAWIIYQIKVAFGFDISFEDMLQIVRKHCNQPSINLGLCLQKIAKKKYPKINDYLNWKKQQNNSITNFIQNCQDQMKYFDLSNSFFKDKKKKQQSNILDQSFTVQSISAIAQINQSSFQQTQILKQCFPEPQISNITHHSPFLNSIKILEKQLNNVFKGIIVNYQHLYEFSLKQRSNSRISNYLINRLKVIDERLLIKINECKGITISIKNQLVFQYLQLIIDAQVFYDHITIFMAKVKSEFSLKINFWYLKEAIKKFLLHYESLYLELFIEAYQQQQSNIQQKFTSFFCDLERMIFKFFSKQFEQLKTNMLNTNRSAELKIDWSSFKEKAVTDYIRIIIKAIKFKFAYIFTEFDIDYKQLRQIWLRNKKNPLIVQSIIFEIKKCDQRLYEQINGMGRYSEDLLFEDQNLNYFKLLKLAYAFYCQITNILQKNGETISLKLSLQYFQSSLGPFVQQYQHIYQKIMQNIYTLKYKSIPQKIKLFFSNLEQLTSKILPKDYQKIKNRIFQIPLNQDFNIQYDDISQDKSITHRFCRINQEINDGISNDFTKVLNIFKKSSKKYYVYLQQEQKKRYLQKLKQHFTRIVDKYEYQAKDEKDDCEQPVLNFFTLVPDSRTRQTLQNQFQMIKIQLANAKKQVQVIFSRGLKQRNFYEIVKIYKQMNSRDQAKNKNQLKYFINRDFQSIFDQSISKKQLIQQYQQLCSKYEGQAYVMKQLQGEYSIIKQQAKDKIAERILFLVEENKTKIQQNDYQQIGHLIQNNQNIIHAYKYFIDNDKEASLRIIQKIEDYFETVLILYRLDIKSNQSIANMHKWEFSEVQKLIRQQFYLRQIAMPIMNQLAQYKYQIKQFKSSEKIQIMFSDQHKNQFLSLITQQIIFFSKQVTNFSFQQLFKKLPLSVSEQVYREQLQFLVQKIVLISKIEPVFKQYRLDKIRTPGNTSNISNLEPFKSKIIKEIKSAIQQTQLIKQTPQKQLPRKLICLSILCQLISKNKDMQISNKLGSIYNQLFKEISFLMGGFLSQIQLINIQPSQKKVLQTAKKLEKMEKKLSTDQFHIQKAQAVINSLIVVQKMQVKLQLFSQFIKENSMQIIKLIQKNRILLTVIINKIKIKQLPETKKIINKYQIFKPTLNNFNKNEVQKKDAKLLFEQFKVKNQIKGISQYMYQDYLDFKQSFIATLAKYLQSPSEITISAISNDIRNSISIKHKNQVIGKLLGLYAIIKRNQLQQITFYPYPSQFLCISLLLQFGQPFSQMKLKKNIVSMLPGEGKTIALAITACILVLKGYRVYPICQSQYLAQENQQHFKQLFQALKIKTDEIKYQAIDQFCEQITNPGSTKQLIKNQLLGQHSKQQKKGDQLKFLSRTFFQWTSLFRQSNKVILMDQINIIFSEHFEGKVYEPIIEIKDEGRDTSITDIFEYIYNRSKTQYLLPKSIMKTKLFQDLIGDYSRISQIIRSQIAAMLNDVLDERKINEYYQQGRKKKNLQNNTQNANAFTGYQQLFAYLKLKEQGFISQKQIKNKLKLYIKIGQYSVSQLFRNFDTILGVGSTLQCLQQKDKMLLNNYYEIQNIYYIPPIYQYRNITEFTSICQGDLQKKLVVQIKSHFLDKKQRSAMIIFFKDHRSLNQFKQQAITKITECQGLKINYLYQQNQERIEMVTSSKCLTLATKQFARGYNNYKDDHLTKGLCVIQTYLPSNTYQLQQTKGRTARHGRPGKFSLLLPIQELQLIDRGLETYLNNIKGFWREINQKDYYRRQVRRKQAKQKHNIIQYEQGGKIISYLQKINRVQFKPIERSFLIVFGLSQNFISLTDWLLDQLQKYQDLIRKNQMKIKLRYQICYYGNYTNYTSKSYVEQFKPHQNILKAFKIGSLSDLKQKFKRIKPIETNVINQQESTEIFLRHVLRLSQRQTVRSCFIWGNLKNYSWSKFKRTAQFQMHDSRIRKQLGIQQDMKTPQQYIALIKSKNIIVNCRNPNINQYKNYKNKFELQFRDSMRQAIPYLKSIVIQ